MVTTQGAVNTADCFNHSALQLAAAEGHHCVVEFLISQGANVHATDKWGSSALMYDVQGDHTHVQQLLIAVGTSHNDTGHNAAVMGWKLREGEQGSKFCVQSSIAQQLS